MKGLIGTLVEQGLTRWQAMNVRERWLVAGGAFFLLLVFIYFVAFKPAWDGRNRLQDQLPVMRAKLASMESMATEIKALRNVRASRLSAAAVRDELQRMLSAAGLDSQASVDAGQEVMRVKFDRVSFDAMNNWLFQVVRDLKVRVVDVSVKREATAGRVTATVSLQRPGVNS